MNGRTNLFLKALAATLDSDGDGLPDWWETLYSTTNFPLSPTNADTGNTGIPDGYKQDWPATAATISKNIKWVFLPTCG